MSIRHLSLLLTLLYIISACQSPSKAEKSGPFGPFMGINGGDSAQYLAVDLIGSSLDEYNGSFSPDGTAFFFTINTPAKGYICHASMNEDSSWGEVQIAPFSGTYSEYDPLFSPDGKRLYFSSERPLEEGGSFGKSHIWYVEKKDSWQTPQYVPLTGKGDYHSSITKDGKIYFNVWDTGDMYVANPVDTGYQVSRLPDVINSSNGEGDPFISPDEDYLIYRGYTQSMGRGDLYISFKKDDQWSIPQNLGRPINSPHHEMCPNVSPDGKHFIFASSRLLNPYGSQASEAADILRNKHKSPDNGQLNIYYLKADFIEGFRKKAIFEKNQENP